MQQLDFEPVDTEQFKGLPALSANEAAWMSGVTLEAYERFMKAAGVDDLRSIRPDKLVRTAFTLLGQKESQLVMLRLQLAATLQREKELAEALGSKLGDHNPLALDFLQEKSSAAPESAFAMESGGGKKKKKKKKQG